MRNIIPTINNLRADYGLRHVKRRAPRSTTKIAPTPSSGLEDLSVLIIGASGRTGMEVAQALAVLASPPKVYAFVRNPAKISANDRGLFTSVFQGDARVPMYIERALEVSRADVVVVCIGDEDSNEVETDVRTASARALERVLRKRRNGQVRVIVVSSVGAGSRSTTKAETHWHLLARDLRDHTFMTRKTTNQNRTTVVRSTVLTTGFPSKEGIVTFDETESILSPTTGRGDLAKWIVYEALIGKHVGFSVNVTSFKRTNQGEVHR